MNFLEATISGFILALWVSVPVSFIVAVVATGGNVTMQVWRITYVVTGIMLTFMAITTRRKR